MVSTAGSSHGLYNADRLHANQVALFCELDGGGEAGTPLTVTFTVVEGPQGDAVISYTLVRSGLPSGYEIADLPDGYLIDVQALGTNQLSIEANVNPNPTDIESVVFTLSSPNLASAYVWTENVAPYALFGNGGDGSFHPWNPPPKSGSYTITAVPYTGSGGVGTPGQELIVNFLVYDSSECDFLVDQVGGNQGLITAINAANDEVTNPGANVVCLTGNDYVLDQSYVADSSGNGLPTITSDITIIGNGATIRRTGNARGNRGIQGSARPAGTYVRTAGQEPAWTHF